jgi:outer membrane lipoprotein-sorting protein
MQQKNRDPRALKLLDAVTQRGKTIQSLTLDTLRETPPLKTQGKPLRAEGTLFFKRPAKYKSIRYFQEGQLIALSNNGNDIQLNSSTKTYLKSPLTRAVLDHPLPYLDGWSLLHSPELWRLTYLGTERLQGLSCDVLKGEFYHSHSEGPSLLRTTHLYISPDKLIYRVRDEEGASHSVSQLTYSRVTINPSLPDSLFLLPSGYTPVHDFFTVPK